MATELMRPGVEVIQEFRTVSPTVVTPTLVPCAVGPAFQILEALKTDATGNRVLNTDAVASVAAVLTAANPGLYMGLDGLKLAVSVNGGPEQEFTLADPTAVGLSAGQVKDQIAAATVPPSGFGAYVSTQGGSSYLQLRSTGKGDGQTLKVLTGSANTILGFHNNYIAEGTSTYKQDKVRIEQLMFPDPRGIIDELDIDEDSIRVFINTGASLKEVLRTSTFLRRKKLCRYTSGTISFPLTGITGKKFSYKEGETGTTQTYTFVSDPSDVAGLVSAMNALIGTVKLYVNGANKIDFLSDAGRFEVMAPSSNTAHAMIGWTDGAKAWTLEVLDPGDGSTKSVFIVVDEDNFSAVAGPAQLTGSTTITTDVDVHNKTFHCAVDGGQEQEVIFDGGPIVSGSAFTGLILSAKTLGLAVNGVTKSVTFTGGHVIPTSAFNGVGLGTKVLNLSVGGSPVVVTFSTGPDLTITQAITEINTAAGATVCYRSLATGVADPAGTYITFQVGGTSPTGVAISAVYAGSDGWSRIGFAGTADLGPDLYIADAIAQINAQVGATVCYRSNSTGAVDPAGTYISYQVGGAVEVSGSSIVLTYATSTGWAALGLTGVVDLDQMLTLAEIVTALNATFGTGFAAAVTNHLQINSLSSGDESKLEIGNGTANTILGLTLGQVGNGSPFPVAVGDAIYGDGSLVGYVVQVAPGGYTNRLKLDRKVALDFGAAAMYVEAMGLTSPLPANRPTPDLVVDLSGAVTVKNDILRSTEGAPIVATGSLVISYKALRLDVSPAAAEPGLLSLSDTTDLSDSLEPVNADNPLALQLYFMLINAAGITVAGIGVDAVSSGNPDGTPEAYSRACGFLQAQEVYALAPTSQDPTVHQIFATHVTSMSEPDNKGERIVFICPEMPGEAIPKVATSGTDGDSTATTNEFDTKIPSLATDVLNAGVNPVGTIPVSAGLYLTIASNTNRYSISAISSTKISIRVAFSPGENDDQFYATTNLPADLISETFSIKVRGEELVDSNGKPDYEKIAQAYQDLGKTYGNRRVIMVAPEKLGANVDGAEQKIPGYYLCGAIAGMVGRLPPQQGFTNYPVTGFTRVFGSNDVFNEHQLNVGAAGGTYWVIQEVAGAPVSCRHQLTTDLTSIETRELSITKIVDFTAKFMRAGLRSFIGKFNVTQSFLDTLSTVVQGQLGFLAESGVIIGGDLNNIVQDEKAPDTVLIDVTLDVPYPCNYIRLTLVI